MSSIYLDYSSATPLDKSVAKKMRLTENIFANPSTKYASGREASQLLESSRKKIAMFFGANTDEIIFTSGATESNNLAILGSARKAKQGRIISIETEHSSIRGPVMQLSKEGFSVDWCKVDKAGRVNVADFISLLRKDTVLVSISYANGEIGTILQIAKLVQEVRKFEKANSCKIIFHTDASSALALLSCDVSRLGIDLLTASSAKIYGPKGIGLLYVRRKTQLQQLMYGGNQESGLRAGTESLPLVVGFASAVELIAANKASSTAKYQQYYISCMHNLEELDFIENGHPEDRLYSVLSICFEGLNGEDLVAYLDAQGFEVSTGAACEASNDEPSSALMAIGRTRAQAQGSLRISFGRSTTPKQVDLLQKCLKKTISALL